MGPQALPRINRRFRFSERWLSQNESRRAYLEQRRGTVIRETKDPDVLLVRFDGNAPSTTFTYHRNFIEFIEEPEQEPGQGNDSGITG